MPVLLQTRQQKKAKENFPKILEKGKKKKQSAAISLDKRKKTETFVEICEREQRYSIIQLRLSC